MKNLTTVLVATTFLFSQIAGAAPVKKAPSPKAPVSSAPKTPPTFTLNPTSLQKQVLGSNLSILLELYKVHDAKDQVNVARGNLLPSLNLGESIAAGTGFFMSAVDFLLPFLIPSNWNNYYSEKDLFQSEKLSYKIIELNTYSSALATYYNTLSDHHLKEVYQQEYLDLQSVFETQKRNSAIGNIPTADLLLAQAQAQAAGIKASQLQELNASEIASLRSVLNLSLDMDIALEEVNMPESTWEYQPVDAVVNQVNSVAPERTQLKYLIKSAEQQKWSRVFSFINGASLGSQTFVPGQNASFNFANMIGTGSFNFGFAQFPLISLSERNITEIQVQDRELVNENTRVIETALAALQLARQQLDMANQAAEEMAKVYAIKLNNYTLGSETFTNVVLARNQWADASVSQVKAQLDLNLQRVTLHRALLTDHFASVRGCLATEAPTEGRPGLIGRLVGKHEPSHATLDQLCKAH